MVRDSIRSGPVQSQKIIWSRSSRLADYCSKGELRAGSYRFSTIAAVGDRAIWRRRIGPSPSSMKSRKIPLENGPTEAILAELSLASTQPTVVHFLVFERPRHDLEFDRRSAKVSELIVGGA
jgi:hypothetical protein